MRSNDMTTGNPLNLIIRFMIPVVGVGILQQVYALVDSIIVGQGVGVEALAAIGTTDWLRNIVLWSIMGLCDGFGIMVAISYGEKNESKLLSFVNNALLLSMTIGVAVSMLGAILAPLMLGAIGTSEDLMTDAAWYLRITYGSSFFAMTFAIGSSILKAMGDSKTSFYAIIITSIINVALDLIFVFCFHWGVIGVAIATGVAQCASGLYCIYRVNRLGIVKLSERKYWGLNWCASLICKGVPVAFNMSVVAIGGVILQIAINKAGFIYVASFAATNKTNMIYEAIAIALGSALTTYIGQNYGAGSFARMRQGERYAFGIGGVASLLFGALILFGGKYIMYLFIEPGCEGFDDIVAVGTEFFAITGIGLFTLYALHIYRQSLLGRGKVFWPVMSGVGELIGRVGAAFILTQIIGWHGLCCAEVAAFVCADLFLIAPFYLVRRNERIDIDT